MPICSREKLLREKGCHAQAEGIKTFDIGAGRVACEACIKPVVKQLEKQANTDFNTGLHNRRYLDEKIEEYAEGKKPFGIVHIDLQNFKKVNQRRGQKGGDFMLRICAESLKGKRETDITAHLGNSEDIATRIGGDEFAIIMDLTPREATDTSDPKIRLLRAAHYFQQSFRAHPDVIGFNEEERLPATEQLSMHFGVSVYGQDGTTLDELLAASDPKFRTEI